MRGSDLRKRQARAATLRDPDTKWLVFLTGCRIGPSPFVGKVEGAAAAATLAKEET